MNEDSGTTTKVELFGPAWLELARGYLEREIAAAGPALDDVRFAICEVLTDPPAHLADPGTNRVSWHVRVEGPTVEVGAGEIDCPFKIVADYQSVLPKARTVYEENPEALAATRDEHSDLPDIPEALGPLLLGLHDFLARRTA